MAENQHHSESFRDWLQRGFALTLSQFEQRDADYKKWVLKAYSDFVTDEQEKYQTPEKKAAEKRAQGQLGVTEDVHQWLEGKGISREEFDKLPASEQLRLCNLHSVEIHQNKSLMARVANVSKPAMELPAFIRDMDENDPRRDRHILDECNRQAWARDSKTLSN